MYVCDGGGGGGGGGGIHKEEQSTIRSLWYLMYMY